MFVTVRAKEEESEKRTGKKAESRRDRRNRFEKKIGGAMEWMDGHRGIIDRVSVFARDHGERREY